MGNRSWSCRWITPTGRPTRFLPGGPKRPNSKCFLRGNIRVPRSCVTAGDMPLPRYPAHPLSSKIKPLN